VLQLLLIPYPTWILEERSVTVVETIGVVILCWGKLCESYDSVLFCTPSQTSQPYARESINNPLQGELYATPLSCHTWGSELIWRHKEFLFSDWEPKHRLIIPRKIRSCWQKGNFILVWIFSHLNRNTVMKQRKKSELSYLSLNKIPDLNNIQFDDNYMYSADLTTLQYTTRWIYVFHVK